LGTATQAAVEGDAAGIEGMVAVVTGGRSVAGVECAAETSATRVKGLVVVDDAVRHA
jgi:hypothetical protein